MKNYRVALHRDYIVNIKAKNKEEAKFLAEYVIGGERDISTEKEKKQFKFKIEEIEMVTNDAFELKKAERV